MSRTTWTRTDEHSDGGGRSSRVSGAPRRCGLYGAAGFEAELDATLINKTGVEVMTYMTDSPTGDRLRGLTTEPGGNIHSE